MSDIDLDFNYLCNNRTVNSHYYNEQKFNRKFNNNSSFSLIHLNSRSVPLHCNTFLCYLGTLDIEFKIIVISDKVSKAIQILYGAINVVLVDTQATYVVLALQLSVINAINLDTNTSSATYIIRYRESAMMGCQ